MNLELHTKIIPRGSDVIEALAIRTAECYGAMAFANAIAGAKSVSWDLVHTYSLEQLKAGAGELGLFFTGERDKLKGEIWSTKKESKL